MATISQRSFRVGRVCADRRGSIWYLGDTENRRRRRPRVGSDRQAARQLAAEINAQLETGAPAALSFDPISIEERQRRWLERQEHVLRSSLHTIRRYRTATRHLLTFLEKAHPSCRTSSFSVTQAEEFVRYLRAVKVAPNGHLNASKRPLLDHRLRYILETCRSMFHYALKRRHLSPYAENPFSELELDRLPIETFRPVRVLSADMERRFLEACDNWRFRSGRVAAVESGVAHACNSAERHANCHDPGSPSPVESLVPCGLLEGLSHVRDTRPHS